MLITLTYEIPPEDEQRAVIAVEEADVEAVFTLIDIDAPEDMKIEHSD